MERICYCPSEEHLEEAQALAEPWGVHIQTGESQATEPLEFDRELVQILNIPTEQHFAVSSGTLRPYETLACNYVDEFTVVTDVLLSYDGPTGTTQVAALNTGNPHGKGWRIRFPTSGNFKVRVHDKDGDIAVEIVTVVPW